MAISNSWKKSGVNNSRLFIFNVSQGGVGSTITSNIIISGDNQNSTTFTFDKPGSFRINNFLSPLRR